MNPLRIAVFLVLALAAPQAPATVQGIVLKSATAEPIAGARVELIRTDGSTPQSYSAVSAPDGTFTIVNARPGQYRLAASRSGFLRREFGQRSGSGFGVVLILNSGQQIGNLEIELRPSAAIYGRVTDRQGSPAVAVEVKAMEPAAVAAQLASRNGPPDTKPVVMVLVDGIPTSTFTLSKNAV